MKFKVNNKTDSPIEYEGEIHSLCGFAQERIGFKKPPSIFVNDDISNAGDTLAKTGHYDPNTMEIHVFATGRHPKDILRSIAHELVHHGQHMRGELDMKGYSGKGYAQKNPKLRQAEIEANDPMLFRDWEDSLKEKENTIYNERRNRKMSIKDWKNKELKENLSRKWGFKMDLGKLSEGMGAHADDPMGGMQSQEIYSAAPMDKMQMCIEQRMSDSNMSEDEAKFACMKEMQNNQMAQGEELMDLGDMAQRYYPEDEERMPFQEVKEKKPDADGDGVPDWADKDDEEGDKDEESEKSSDKPKKGKMPKGLADYHAKKSGKKKDELDEVSAAGAVHGYAGTRRRK